MIDIEKLKQAALAATQGEWVVSDHIYAADGKRVASYHTLYRDDVDNYNNATHIATASPSAVLELITRLESTESQLAAQELVIQQLRDALEKIACVGNGNTHGNSVGNCLAIEALAIPTSTKHLEAWYKGQVGEPVASAHLSGYTSDLGVGIKFSYGYELRKIVGNDGTSLHAIKPFPFKEE